MFVFFRTLQMFSWYDLNSDTVATNALSVTGIVACITSIFQLILSEKVVLAGEW